MKTKEKDFDEVQRALALKRHEQPPPKYFQNLSGSVLDRLQDPAAQPPRTLPERLGLGEDWKPLQLIGLGVVACAAVIIGLVLALRVDKPDEAIAELGSDPAVKVYEVAPTPRRDEVLPGFEALGGTTDEAVSTQPVMTPGAVPSFLEPLPEWKPAVGATPVPPKP